MENILSTQHLSVGYLHGNTPDCILSDLDLAIEKGKLIALIGANGIGKSTLLRTIAGTQRPLSGSVSIEGKDIASYSRHQLARVMGLVYTDRTAAGGLTAYELVALGRQPHTGFLGRLSAADREIVLQAMRDTGISHKADCFAAELSDGERQKVMIAKALAQQTPLIILDEPTAFLDVASRIDTMLLLHRLAHEQGKAVLLSSHDISQSILIADELWLVTHDRTLLCGNTEDIILSGGIDRMFDSSIIGFDKQQGDFSIKIKARNAVNLECDDRILRRWVKNALKRNAIGVEKAAGATISASSASCIDITAKSGKIHVQSIAEMLNALDTILKDTK